MEDDKNNKNKRAQVQKITKTSKPYWNEDITVKHFN